MVDYLRVDMLKELLESVTSTPRRHQTTCAPRWIEKAIEAAFTSQSDWIVEFCLASALGSLKGKRFTTDLSNEIESVLTEFRS